MNLVKQILKESNNEMQAAAMVLVKEGKVLILKRGSTAPYMPNKWNFPGGHVDPGETPDVAAIRECKEEAGIKISSAKLLCKKIDPDGYTIYFYIANTNETEKINWESSKSKWIDVSELSKYQFVPFVKEIILSVLKTNSLKESAVIDMLDQEANVYSNMGRQSYKPDMIKWIKSQAKVVKVVSWKTLPIANDIAKYLKRPSNKPKLKGCFSTAYFLTTRMPGIKYVEGRGDFQGMLGIDHGWNSYNGIHFDLTAEELFNSKMFEEYVMFLELDLQELTGIVSDLERTGPFTDAYYFKNVLNQWDEPTIERLKHIF